MAPEQRVRRTAFASTLGTILEYYDFFIYGTASALVFNKVFFPGVDPLVGTLAAFSTYAVGYFARPLGGLVMGIRRPDRPQATLVFTLLLTGPRHRDRPAAHVRADRHLGRDPAGRAAHSRLRRRR